MIRSTITLFSLCLLLAFQSHQAVAQCGLMLNEEQVAALSKNTPQATDYGGSVYTLLYETNDNVVKRTVSANMSPLPWPGAYTLSFVHSLEMYGSTTDQPIAVQCLADFIFKLTNMDTERPFDDIESWEVRPAVKQGLLQLELYAEGELKYTLK